MLNPTRMELLKLKKKLKVAKRGYNLLKEKRDGLMKEFMAIIREAKKLREIVEADISKGFKYFIFTSAQMGKHRTNEAIMSPNKNISIEVSFKNVMSVNIPQFKLDHYDSGNFICYSLAQTPITLDNSLRIFSDNLSNMINLARIEHSARLLAIEIEKTRRRVNALQYVFLPEMETNIKYIKNKLDEQERSALIGLMRIKESII